jgi:hypothetical protein
MRAKESERMLFMAILKHSPENCFARPENVEAVEEIRRRFSRLDEFEKEAGVKLLGAYLNSNEHTFYFVLESDDYSSVSRFLGGPMLTYHTAKITPVRDLKEVTFLTQAPDD